MNPKSSNHPVHILDREGNIAPSSFIPFCSFGNDMKSMGKYLEGFPDPVCDSFEAKIRNDQLCYEVDLEKYKDENNIKEQLESGLVLILGQTENSSQAVRPSLLMRWSVLNVRVGEPKVCPNVSLMHSPI